MTKKEALKVYLFATESAVLDEPAVEAWTFLQKDALADLRQLSMMLDMTNIQGMSVKERKILEGRIRGVYDDIFRLRGLRSAETVA